MEYEFYLPYPNTENLERLNSITDESFIHPTFKNSLKELFALIPQELLSYVTSNNIDNNTYRPKSAAKIEIKYTKPGSLYYDIKDIKEEIEIDKMAVWSQRMELELFNKETKKFEKVIFGLSVREGLTDEDPRMLFHYKYKLYFFISTPSMFQEVEAASDNIQDFKEAFDKNDFVLFKYGLEEFKKYDI